MKKVKGKVFVNAAYSFKEADEFNRKFWRQAGPFVRFATAWEMIRDYYKIRGNPLPSFRLQKNIVNVVYRD